jgi:RNA-directed DNA polymerase
MTNRRRNRRGKLDATTMLDTTELDTAAVAASGALVNGPEDEPLDWDAIQWRHAEEDVRRLRQRIFAASRAGDLKRVRNLQKLLLRSRGNALVAVRRVTELNAGRKTAGVDGTVVVSPEQKAELVDWLQHRTRSWSPRPVKRVYVPKSNGRRRPLGIPVIADRCLQALTVNALEPEWEARFEPKSYGFRPGRGCHDAIVAIHTTASRTDAQRRWVLDADLAAAFDHLNHDHICASLGTFPAVGLVRQWLKAGVIEDGGFLATEEGAPQGGVISPLLMNVALHGMEAAAGVRYHTTGTRAGKTMPGCPVVIRYADDLLGICHSREQAEQVKARLSEWLAPRGLVFNETKTRITNFDTGVDFLGFTIRRFRGKLLTKPSNDALRRIRRRLSTEVRALRGANADTVIAKLNPIITGWAAYYRIGASKRAFGALDAHVWRLVYKWASFSHANKSKRWVIARYFGKFNPARQDKWIFGSQDTGFYLRKFAWTPIVRHRMVAGTASPDDPCLPEYWAQRRRRSRPPGMSATTLRLLRVQRGRCPLCQGLLLHADREPQNPREWEQWLTATRTAIRHHAVTVWGAGTPDERAAIRLIHAHCRRRATGGAGGTAPLHAAREPSGLA